MEETKFKEKTRWTKEQLEAITEKDCNLLVAAAAGAGKTAVLVERIIRKITCDEKPVDIDRLLIVTFTNAAATEMRERIAVGISKALDKNPDSKLLQRQLALLSKANITTIHSFCLEVIKNNFHYIGLNPGFRIADETEALLMKMETLEDLFENIYDGEIKKEFFDLLECYGGNRDDQALKNMILTLYEFVQSHPWPKDWLTEKTEYFNLSYDEDFAKTRWGQLLLKNVAIECINYKEMMEKAILVIEKSDGLAPYLLNFQKETSEISSFADMCNTAEWDKLYDIISAFEFERLPRCKKDVDKSAQEYVKSIRDDVKSRIKKLQNDIITAPSRDIIKDLNSLYPLIKHLSELVLEFERKYAEIKREKSLLDFNDLEHFCLNILTERNEGGRILPSDVALEYKEKFEEILVDEYQDSNLVQETILNVISRENPLDTPNMFMVGDVKQSIYRFRQSRPELFLEKYSTYSDEKGEKHRKIKLYKNFRSRKEVIDSVNFIFRRIMSEDAGEIDYNDEEALNPGAVYDEPYIKEYSQSNMYKYNDESDIKECHESDTQEYDKDRPDVQKYHEFNMQEENTGRLVAGGPTELHIITMEECGSEEHEDGYDEDGSESRYENGAEAGGLSEDLEEDMDEGAEIGPLDAIQCEARLVANRIKELVGNEKIETFVVYDKNKKKYRPIEYRDIVILLRATRNWADVFVEELTTQGIPTYADTGAGFFKTVEVQIILSLLQIIDNPLQDIPLLAVLRSPIALFTPDELADIRLADKDAFLYDALRKVVGLDDGIVENVEAGIDGGTVENIGAGIDEQVVQDVEAKINKVAVKSIEWESNKALVKKVADFLKTLDIWRDKALYMSTDELIWYLYTETGFYSYVGAMPGGEQRQANLRMLFEQARKFEETSYRGLFNFINFINKLKSGRGDMGSAKILGENENVIRIMSIHKSKGLEFPVVILSGCGKGFNFQDMNRSLILHQELGFGPDYVDYEKRIAYPTAAKQALRYRIKTESLSEEMRILYVGFTRAREKLILTGSVKDMKKAVTRWKDYGSVNDKKIPGYIILRGNNYLDWICAALWPILSSNNMSSDMYIPSTMSQITDTDDVHCRYDCYNHEMCNYDTCKHDACKHKDACKHNLSQHNNYENDQLWYIKVWNKKDILKDVLRDAFSEETQGEQYEQKFTEKVDEIRSKIRSKIRSEIRSEVKEGVNANINQGYTDYYKEINRRLNWDYKYIEASRIPVKISVTELKRQFAFETSEEYPAFSVYTPSLIEKPAFLEESKGLNAAEIGTVLHFVMQRLDLNSVSTMEQIKSQVEEMVEKELLTKQQASTVDIHKINNFFTSQLGKRMLKAEKVYREVPFNMQVGSKEFFVHLDDELYKNEAVLLQGVIDCFFEEQEGLVLLDYKTDYIPSSTKKSKQAVIKIKERYKLQIEYYAKVLEKLLKKKLKKDIYIYSGMER